MALLQATASAFSVTNPLIKVGDYTLEVDDNGVSTNKTKTGIGKYYNDTPYTSVNFDALGEPTSSAKLQTQDVNSVGATLPLTSSGGSTPVISTQINTNKLVGRSTSGSGVMEEISVGTGLSLSVGVLSATGTSVPTLTQNQIAFGDVSNLMTSSSALEFDGSVIQVNTSGSSSGWGNVQSVVVSGGSESGLSLNNIGAGGLQWNIISTSNSSGIGAGMLSIGNATQGINYLNLDATGIITIGRSDNSNARVTINNASSTFEFFSNDPYFILDGANRRFQLGDYTYDWYGTYIDINDDSSARTITLKATNGVIVNNLSGGGTQFVTVDNTGLLGATIVVGTVTDVTASAPLSSSGGATPNITISLSNTSTNGYLSSIDWNTFNGKQNALTIGNITDGGTDGITVSGGTGAIIGTGVSLSQHVSDATHNGYLSSADWSTFNSKGVGSVTSVSVVTANGVSGSVATSTSTPAITLTLGAITPTSVNSIVLSGSATPVLSVTGTSSISGANTGDQLISLTSDVTGSGTGSFAVTISNNAVTYAKMQSVSTTSKILGSSSTTTAVQELTIGSGLSLTGTTLTATGTGGTVTSISASVPTGLSVSGVPITTSGTIAITLTSGYVIPTTTEETNWNTAYTNRITSLTTTGSGAATLVANVLNIPTPASATFTSLTVTGNSGASTLSAGVLNVPTYTLSGLGGQPLATNLTSLSGLTYVSASFVKMSASGTFSLDTNTYITGNQTITLSGEASGSGATSIAVTLTNSAVIGKVLTGYVSGAGTVSATDTILQAIQKLNGNAGGTAATVAQMNAGTDNTVMATPLALQASKYSALGFYNNQNFQ